jgi:farnesyl-diphosphate farnesyltransferase
MQEMYEPGNEQRAAWVQSGMIVDALRHGADALYYLQFLRNQSAFNFVAIPVTMAMATLELCFMNKNMFQQNDKIRKAEAASVRPCCFC